MFQPVYLDVIFSIFSTSIVPLIKNEFMKFSRYQFMVYKGLINPKTAQKYEDYGIIVGFNYFTKKSPHISVQAPFEI